MLNPRSGRARPITLCRAIALDESQHVVRSRSTNHITSCDRARPITSRRAIALDESHHVVRDTFIADGHRHRERRARDADADADARAFGAPVDALTDVDAHIDGASVEVFYMK